MDYPPFPPGAPVLLFRTATPDDVPKCFRLEEASYPSDESASHATLEMRQRMATEHFVVCEAQGSPEGANTTDAPQRNLGGTADAATTTTTTTTTTPQLLGFVCGTRCHALDETSLRVHDPTGPLLAIHSVVVAKPWRRRGIASRLLEAYLEGCRQEASSSSIREVVLMAKSVLLSFYVDRGFHVVGPSAVVHGADRWYECRLSMGKERDVGMDSDAGRCSIDSGGPSYCVVDSFVRTADRFDGSGNPAAIVIMEEGMDANVDASAQEQWMRKVAAEFNLSETAYLWKLQDEDGPVWRIRFFTSKGVEVDLCGHATLAAAATLKCTGTVTERVTFRANQHTLNVTVEHATECASKVFMNFPRKSVVDLPPGESVLRQTEDMLQRSLSLDPKRDILRLGRGDDDEDLFVELTSEAFERLPPMDEVVFSPMAAYRADSTLPTHRGIILCCVNGGDGTPHDFRSRFFAPGVGITEDPVTGSAHCLLAPYFGAKLGKDGCQSVLRAHQASSRGGNLECTLTTEGTVQIAGIATVVMQGRLSVCERDLGIL